MHTTLRAALGALLALVLTGGLLDIAAASPEHRADSRRAEARQALAVLDALAAPSTRRLLPGRPLPRTDVSLVMRDLVRSKSALPPAERARADALTTGPAGGLAAGQSSVPYGCDSSSFTYRQTSAHFAVYYGFGRSAQASATLEVLEQVWQHEVGVLGYRSPPPDDDGIFDVALCDTGALGIYGYCVPDAASRHSSSFCVLDDDFTPSQFGGAPEDSLRVTAAHEFFHAVQFGYDAGEDPWFMEGTAVWVESQVYPAITDYLQYLKRSSLTQPQVPLDYAGELDRYGSVLFWKFLSERYRDVSIVRRTWEYADAGLNSLQSVAAALGERGSTMAGAFGWYGVWNTMPAGSYAAGALYPAQPWWQVATLGKRKRKQSTGRRSVRLNHLTSAAMLVRPARLPKRTRLHIELRGPLPNHASAITVQVRYRTGATAVREVALSNRGERRLRVPFDPRKVSAVVIVLGNAGINVRACRRGTAYACGGTSVDDGLHYAVRAKVTLPKRH